MKGFRIDAHTSPIWHQQLSANMGDDVSNPAQKDISQLLTGSHWATNTYFVLLRSWNPTNIYRFPTTCDVTEDTFQL